MNEKVIQVDYKNKKIYLIPTAHVSVESAKMVEETIDEILQTDAKSREVALKIVETLAC